MQGPSKFRNFQTRRKNINKMKIYKDIDKRIIESLKLRERRNVK